MVAYFSMEYALQDLPFAGGLGVLAADYLLECQKQNFPLIGVGLAYGRKPGLNGNLLLLESEFTQPYDSDLEVQIKKEMFLAFEGVKKLRELGIKPDVYHLNEGHTAFVILADPAGKFVATKHTVLSASGLHIPENIFQKMVEPFDPTRGKLYELGSDQNHPEFFSCNKFMLKHALRSNGVSLMHCEVEREVHKNSPLIPITNGINPQNWQAAGTHRENKAKMINFINEKTGSRFRSDVLTIVWARRLAEYKQPELILDALPKLAGLSVQFVVAGHASSFDPAQQSIMERLEAAAKNPQFAGQFTFLPDYGLDIAKILVAGADVWLNTPLVGKEACGTSTMKALLNGALLLSTRDGWVAQEDWSHGGGWLLGDIAGIIRENALPLFADPKAWEAHMNLNRNLILNKYTTDRMLSDYRNKLYNI